MTRAWSAAAACMLVAASVSLLAQPPRQDGEWDVKMTMDMGGRIMEMPVRQCITKEQARDPAKAIPSGPGAPSGCKLLDNKVTGSTVTVAMSCDGPPPMKMNAEFVYKGDSYTGTMTSESGGRTMTMKLAAKRLGDCTTPAK
ncbi:MAG: DUF3617 domain-containing protein [Vicinamibacterales bacterium]